MDEINKSMILPILENSREFFSILEISLFSRIKKSREIQHHYLVCFDIISVARGAKNHNQNKNGGIFMISGADFEG